MLVSNIEELRSAIEDNETEIVLAESGDFVDESVEIDRGQQVLIKGKEGITIRSENLDKPQTLVGLDIREGAENIRIENVKLTGWDKDNAAAGLVTNSNNIVFSNVTFEGRDDFESIRVFGLRVNNSDNVTVENSQFYNLRKGITKGTGSDDFKVIGNQFVGLFEDAMVVSDPNGVTIENNIIRDFDPEVRELIEDPHADAIQFNITNSDIEDQNVSIKNNVALIGDGPGFQGIFIEATGNGFPDSEGRNANNFDIENNLIHTRMGNGIYIDKGGENINIKRNTVVFRDSEATDSNTDKSAIIVGNTENPVVEDNIAGKFVINGESFGGGVSAKEPTNGNIAANFKSFGADVPYEEVFVNGDVLTDPEFYSTISPEDFAVLDGINVGANLGQLPDATAGDPIGGMSGGSGNPEPSPEPTTSESEILISFGNANDNNDVFGTAEADVMEANADSSGLRGLGRDGNDTLLGANNVDLSGENGDDLLVLNGGDSFISGGAESDTFVINSETRSGSTILDFEKGIDTIVFEEIEGVSSISDLDITPQNQSFTANSFINFGDEQIKVKDMMVEDFSAEDFEFL